MLNQTVSHIFSHFRVLIKVETITISETMPPLPDGYFWVPQHDLSQKALPTVMMKCLKAARLV